MRGDNMARKPFDKELYRLYDQKAKQFAKKAIEAAGFTIEENERKTGVDLIVKENNRILFYVETEIKTYLNEGKRFNFSTLHLPERKTKFCGLKYPTLFMLQ